jgi:uncharacterized membrane protein
VKFLLALDELMVILFQYTGDKIQIVEKYRTPWLITFILLFFLFIFALSGKKGLGAIAGMIISLSVIIFFVVPQILSGSDPLFVSLVGSFFILFTSIYLAHGFSVVLVSNGTDALSKLREGLEPVGIYRAPLPRA